MNITENDVRHIAEQARNVHVINDNNNHLHQIEVRSVEPARETIENPKAEGVSVTWQCKLCDKLSRIAFIRGFLTVVHDDLSKHHCPKV